MRRPRLEQDPARLKAPCSETKPILKEIAEKSLPRQLDHRRKIG